MLPMKTERPLKVTWLADRHREQLREPGLDSALPALSRVLFSQELWLVFLRDTVGGWTRTALSLSTDGPPAGSHPPAGSWAADPGPTQICWAFQSVCLATPGHLPGLGVLAQTTKAFVGIVNQPPYLPKLCAGQKKVFLLIKTGASSGVWGWFAIFLAVTSTWSLSSSSSRFPSPRVEREGAQALGKSRFSTYMLQ